MKNIHVVMEMGIVYDWRCGVSDEGLNLMMILGEGVGWCWIMCNNSSVMLVKGMLNVDKGGDKGN